MVGTAHSPHSMSSSSCKTPKTSPLPAPAHLQQLETTSLSSHSPRSKHSLKQELAEHNSALDFWRSPASYHKTGITPSSKENCWNT